MHARDLLGPDGPLARAIPGYEHRESQLAMADAVEQALDAEGVLLVEAGTGTGKTLAYLVPAILSGRKVVISTGTKTLQDQIMEHDLPLLERHLGLPVRAACMKGLGNYLCLRRYEEFLTSADADRAPFERLVPTIRRFRETSLSGDRGELSLPEDVPIWSQVASSSETRIGARCAHFEPCFVTRMRRAAEDAQIVVVNHHLFFADLATRGPHGGGAIPDYDAVIFDEAHQVEDVATEFFGLRVSTTRVETLIRDAQRALGAAGFSDASAPRLRAVLDAAAQFFTSLPRPLAGNDSRATLEPQQISEHARESMFRLDAELEALAAHCKLRASGGEAVVQMARRAGAIRDDLASILDGGASTATKTSQVTWTEMRGRSVSLGASPVDVSAIMRDEVLGRTRAVVFTSATLATDDSFAFTKQRLGVDFEVDELIVPSPFDYPRQAALYTPRTMPDPRDPGFLEAAAEEVIALVKTTARVRPSTSSRMIALTSTGLAPSDTLRPRISVQVTWLVFVAVDAPPSRIDARSSRIAPARRAICTTASPPEARSLQCAASASSSASRRNIDSRACSEICRGSSVARESLPTDGRGSDVKNCAAASSTARSRGALASLKPAAPSARCASRISVSTRVVETRRPKNSVATSST